MNRHLGYSRITDNLCLSSLERLLAADPPKTTNPRTNQALGEERDAKRSAPKGRGTRREAEE